MCGASTVALLSFSHFQKIHITRVFKILTIIPPAPSPPVRIAWFPPPGGLQHLNSSPGQAGTVAGLSFKIQICSEILFGRLYPTDNGQSGTSNRTFNCFHQCQDHGLAVQRQDYVKFTSNIQLLLQI